MKQRNGKKKIGSLLLAAAMIITSFQAFGTEIQAEEAGSATPIQFAAKEQLKTFNTDNTDGKNPAKVYFGKNNGNSQEWWIAGSQGGESVTLFAASPLATGQEFAIYSNYTYEYGAAVWGCTYPEDKSIQEVYGSHYGASSLRATLKEWGKSTSYFSATEQALMQETTIYTNDAKNSTNDTKTDCAYSTTDKLYLAYGEVGDKYITVGENASDDLNNGLRIDKEYWGSNRFWLRAPNYHSFICNVRVAVPGSTVGYNNTGNENAVVPAFKLNLSSVLFASAAKVASDSAESGTIADGAVMTLRLDGADKTIGTVSYDVEAGKIVAQKAAGAAGTVSLVVQGGDGTDDWYYSVPAGEVTVVTKEQIKTACSISDINLAECKIWLETTEGEDSFAYAKMADAKTIKTVDSVTLTGVKTEGGRAFPINAFCTTEGIDSEPLTISYTAKGSNKKLLGNADWNKTYQAELTLAPDNSGDMVCVFGDSVSVTVDGDTAQQFTSNEDGTLTVTKEFTTAKRKITDITAPKVLGKNKFINYYTANNILTDNSEIGTQAELALERSISPTTVKKTVTWTMANSGGAAYNAAPGAANTFRWTVKATEITDYDASECMGYDSETGNITGTVTITNKVATAVTLTGSDKTITYDGSVIDVSQYFTIDGNAGEAAYSLVSKEDDGAVTGEGTLSGTVLTVTKTGVFRVKLTTAAKGNYAAGEKTITVTVKYCSEAVTLEPGKTVVRADETIKNSEDGIVTIDKENDGTVDVTVKLLSAGNVDIDENGRLTIPVGGKVQVKDGKELTLPNGGFVDKDGTVSAAPSQPTEPPANPTVQPTKPPTNSPTNPTAHPTNTPTEKLEVTNSGETVSPEEAIKNSEKLDSSVYARWKGNTFRLSWKAVQGAEGYDIFAAQCEKKLDKKSFAKTVKRNKKSVSLAKIVGKRVSEKKNYKFIIKAWKYIGGKKVYIGSSNAYHVAGKKHKKYTNAKKLIPAKKKYTLKKGKKVRLKVRIVKQSKKKELLPKRYGPALRYFSSNKKVATMTSKGKVKAKKKGTCYIYTTALNGLRVKIKIRVK